MGSSTGIRTVRDLAREAVRVRPDGSLYLSVTAKGMPRVTADPALGRVVDEGLASFSLHGDGRASRRMLEAITPLAHRLSDREPGLDARIRGLLELADEDGARIGTRTLSFALTPGAFEGNFLLQLLGGHASKPAPAGRRVELVRELLEPKLAQVYDQDLSRTARAYHYGADESLSFGPRVAPQLIGTEQASPRDIITAAHELFHDAQLPVHTGDDAVDDVHEAGATYAALERVASDLADLDRRFDLRDLPAGTVLDDLATSYTNETTKMVKLFALAGIDPVRDADDARRMLRDMHPHDLLDRLAAMISGRVGIDPDDAVRLAYTDATGPDGARAWNAIVDELQLPQTPASLGFWDWKLA